MRAAWYERNGAADDVLTTGELPDPEPAAGEVLVRIHVAGVNPADIKRRSGLRKTMSEARVIPGDDGAGVVERVGPGVSPQLVGERVWVHSACQTSPFGTTADYVVVPAENAIPLPEGTSFTAGACLGVPAMTAHRCLFADGPPDGLTVLVTGGAGAVGHYAVEMAKAAGAAVLATASTPEKQQAAQEAGADHVIDYRRPQAASDILRLTRGAGVDRVVDVAFGANLSLTSAVIAPNGVIAGYNSDAVPQPALPFHSLMRRGVTIRTVLIFVAPAPALRSAAAHITTLLTRKALSHPVDSTYPLTDVAAAHQRVESGEAIGKVLITTDP